MYYRACSFLKGGSGDPRQNMLTEIQESQYNSSIDELFAKWDDLKNNGSDGSSYVTDGFHMNSIRGEIIKLRKRRDKKFPSQRVQGQLTLSGGEVAEERPIPNPVDNGYDNPQTLARRSERVRKMFEKS